MLRGSTLKYWPRRIAAVTGGLVAWVEAGSTLAAEGRAGVELFEAEVAPGCRATYLVNDAETYVAVVRVRTVRR